MTYKVKFRKSAFIEWSSLDESIQRQFAERLAELADRPRDPSLALKWMIDCYVLTLPKVGFRLVYQVIDNALVVAVIAVGKRGHGDMTYLASKRFR